MQETRDKVTVVNSLGGMNQSIEPLSLSDSDFRRISGTYPKERGIQSRIPGKVLRSNIGFAVYSIADFLGNRLLQTGNGLLLEDGVSGSFATLQTASNTFIGNRDTFAVSPNLELCVRANGEEATQVIDRNGTIYPATIPVPTTGPGIVAAAGGSLVVGKFYCYVYCWVAATAYPKIQRITSINGRICPRGNPSFPSAIPQVTNTNRSISVIIPASPRADIDKAWIFRTAGYDTSAEAYNAASAGLAYFKAEVDPNITFTDTVDTNGVDQVENDNYGASSFKYVIYYEPYWIGFGADILVAPVTWTAGNSNTAVITLTSGKWWPGRANQYFKLSGVTTGGIDGKGTFQFRYISPTTAGIQLGSLTSSSSGTITITPPTTTIYRSKANDPFAWGWTRTVGTTNEALEFALKVGGGSGTAIATIPNESILKVDTEFPTRSYGFNLQFIDNFDQFKTTQKTISETFSASSHASQFAAQTQDGNTVLWAMDYKNFAIVQSNGLTQNVISTPVQNVLRGLTSLRADQVMCHGIYDPYTQCNCMWVTNKNSPSRVHLMIYQHAPTQQWGILEDNDVLCSARVQDITTRQSLVMLGTESGLYGQGFVRDVYDNWSSGTHKATIASATSGQITLTTSASVTIGSWCLITDTDSKNEQWARVASYAGNLVVLDRTFSNNQRFATLQITPTAGWVVYFGLIECRLTKYFDFQAPNSDKQFMEMWLSQQGAVNNDTVVRIFREWQTTPLDQFFPKADFYKNNELSSSFMEKKTIPTELIKSFALEVINRNYSDWILRNMVLKYQLVP